MAEAPKTSKNEDDVKPEDRFRYIGFQVFAKTAEPFWKSENEAQQFAAKVRTGLGESVLHRQFSLLETEPMSRADRWVLTISSAVMLLTVAMPWVGYRTMAGTDFALFWPGALGALLGGIGTAFGAGLAVGLSAILGLVVMIGAPVLGAWSLAMVLRKTKSQDAYLLGLRTPLKYGYLLFFSGLAVFVLSFVGGHIAGFESWGLIDPPEKFGIGTLFSILSFGPYMAMAMGLVSGVKSGDL